MNRLSNAAISVILAFTNALPIRLTISFPEEMQFGLTKT
jgi:hypothetical protein